jgi:hydroxyacylglutathione hydrolase
MKITRISNWDMNSYLLSEGQRFFLIDTQISFVRRALVRQLEQAGVRPGNLKLILLTHGDVDHASNAAYLRERYHTKIAMHRGDLPMAHGGDLYSTRIRKPNGLMSSMRKLFYIRERNQFEPDILVEDGDDLSPYGLNAKVLYLPGHTKGSIGVLTVEGDLFNGDLWILSEAGPGFVIDNQEDFAYSLEKLKKLSIRTIYPGHGVPFSPSQSILQK